MCTKAGYACVHTSGRLRQGLFINGARAYVAWFQTTNGSCCVRTIHIAVDKGVENSILYGLVLFEVLFKGTTIASFVVWQRRYLWLL